MSKETKSIIIDGQEYVPKGTKQTAKTKKGMRYIICRTYSAGVFAGYLKSKKGQEVTMIEARRLWYWDGAASLSQLAMEGVSKPENCKFPIAVDNIELTQTIEIINCTEKARESIKNVPVWQRN